MLNFGAICRVATVVTITVLIGLAALYELLKPVPNDCNMTYMYPTYIPILANVSNAKYGLFLYREGWRNIDGNEYLKKLNGVPVLFIPGNSGSYKQVRSLGKESDRAYQAGPLERMFYQEAYPNPEEGAEAMDIDGFIIPSRYTSMIDWFAVDLEGEHSAMDGQILEEHTEYVVYAINRILDQYKKSPKDSSKEAAETSRSLPRSVILVGHSMGGFVARAAVVHPGLRKGSVETILTLSSPHQSPPVALQPSLARYYARVNQEWTNGYQVQTARAGHWESEPTFSNVVVISVTGGTRDYQVRSKLESLDRIVPPTHGFTIGSTAMKNVWLTTEHQVILWCNQLVVQLSHTLLSLIDSETGQPFGSAHKRLYVFIKMLRSGIPHSVNWMKQVQPSKFSGHVPTVDGETVTESQVQTSAPCPKSIRWSGDGFERDLHIQTTPFTIVTMDGKRRWLDIENLGSDGRNHFVFVTNLTPCSGVRLHLWPRKGRTPTGVPMDKGVIEVTSKMVHIRVGPTPRQTGPGSQTEKAPPSSVFLLGPEDMRGFQFLTIAVAPSQAVSGRPSPAMAVGQFFNPEKGKKEFSRGSLLFSSYAPKEIPLVQDHPLLFNLSFSINLGLLPVTLTVNAVSCGTKKSSLPAEEIEDPECRKLCNLRCFPPVVVAWDSASGVHIIPNSYAETIVVDSSPAFWSSTPGSDETTVLLMVDPHCSYNISVAASVTTAAGRFVLLYNSQIIGLSFALIFFALMWQTHAWELDLPVPSTLTAVESNLRMPQSFFSLGVVPILVCLVLSFLTSQTFPPVISFFVISILCYVFSNGFVIILLMISQLLFYTTANVHIFFKIRFLENFSTFNFWKAGKIIRENATLLTALVASILVCFVHPALGLFMLLLSHVFRCHDVLCSSLAASFPNHAKKNELFGSSKKHCDGSGQSDQIVPPKENSPDSPNSEKSYGDIELEIFNYRHGILILHFLAFIMFVPSLVAWLQMEGKRFPLVLDSTLCIGVILHGLSASNPGFTSLSLSFPRQELGMNFVYLIAGYYCYLSGLAQAPYRAFYAMTTVGIISTYLKAIEKRKREKGSVFFRGSSRKHLHSH